MDERAFEALIRQYYPQLHDYVTRRAGSADTADDILQNVFMRLWDNRASLNVRGSLKSYLFTAARNAVIDAGISERARKEREINASAELIASKSSDNPDPAELTDFSEKVQKAVQELPNACREVFELYRVYDLSYPEIAATLGISLSTVKTQMGRAFAALARNLGPLLALTFLAQP